MTTQNAREQAVAVLLDYITPPPVIVAAPDELLPVKAGQRVAGVPAAKIRELIAAGVIAGAKIGGSMYTRRSDVLSLVEKLRRAEPEREQLAASEPDALDAAIAKANSRRRRKAQRAGAT